MAKFNYNANTVPQLFKVLADVFPEFSTAKAYKAGSYVVYNTMTDEGTATYCGVYVCREDLAAGSWNPAKWFAVEDGETLAEALQNVMGSEIIADTFDAAEAYDVGDYVVKDNKLYRCKAAKAAGAAWSDANWNETNVGDELKRNGKVETDLAPAYNSTSTYNTGDLVTYEGGLYKAAEDGVTGAWDASKWTATTVSGELSSAGADFTLIAANYAETGKSYVIGDFVLYNNKVFKATADHPAPAGAWTGTGWAETKVMDEVGGGGAAAVAPEYVATTSYTVGQVVTHDGLLYECTTATSGEAWTPAHWAEITMSGDLDAFVAAIGKLLGITCVRGYNASTHKVEYTLTLNM